MREQCVLENGHKLQSQGPWPLAGRSTYLRCNVVRRKMWRHERPVINFGEPEIWQLHQGVLQNNQPVINHPCPCSTGPRWCQFCLDIGFSGPTWRPIQRKPEMAVLSFDGKNVFYQKVPVSHVHTIHFEVPAGKFRSLCRVPISTENNFFPILYSQDYCPSTINSLVWGLDARHSNGDTSGLQERSERNENATRCLALLFHASWKTRQIFSNAPFDETNFKPAWRTWQPSSP